MLDLFDRIRRYLRETRVLTEDEYNDLVREYYDLRWKLLKIIDENKGLWWNEWNRLVRDNLPRPFCYEKFYAIKMDKVARKMTSGDDCRISMHVIGERKDDIMIEARSKEWPNTVISVGYFGL